MFFWKRAGGLLLECIYVISGPLFTYFGSALTFTLLQQMRFYLLQATHRQGWPVIL
jgi:hypothetical protein